jgi:superfamily II DNA or RNA helicase
MSDLTGVVHSIVPETGQLVEVRRRQWIVTDIQASMLRIPADSPGQNIVSLTALDEDSLGEDLSVVWELEPGARILERAGLPAVNGWDSCDRIEAFLDAVRWGAATNADRGLLQAPFRSGVDIEDYQLDPLVRAIDMPRANLLIADDVGLGKTIEAGLVIQELIIRHRARTVFIVVPASLQVKWQMEMQEKFGLEFRIVDTEYIRQLRRERGIHANPWTSFPRLIASMDWMKSGEGLRLLKDILPAHAGNPRKFDILVIDEAHNVAPATAASYAMPSLRTRLVRILAPHFENRLFLTATPSNGDQQSFTSLLELLDDQRFARGVMPDDKQKNRVMVRRLKTDIVDKDGKPVYPERELLPLMVDYVEDEREIHHVLVAYTESRAASSRGKGAAFGAEFVHKLLKKRLFSSPRAFAMTLEKHRETLLHGKREPEGRQLDELILHKAIARAEEEQADDAAVEAAQLEAVEAASRAAVALTPEQRKLLDKLSAWAERNRNRTDSKAKALLAWLETHLKTDGKFNGKRVILFTEYRATLSWLLEILAANGWGGERLMELHGATDPEDREVIKAAFQAHPDDSKVAILLATDAASEGIDLQNHCNYLIHIEIPWNPNVMEQRNGRIDRYGQKSKKVSIWHPVGKTAKTGGKDANKLEADHEFLMRAVLKVEKIRQDLGCVGPVIARQIEEAMLGRRVELDTRDAEAKASKASKFLTVEKKLQERIARLHQRLLEAREVFGLSPERVERALSIALELAGKPPLKPVDVTGVPKRKVFEVPMLTGSWDQATRGLEHPHTGIRRRITFDHSIAKGQDRLILAHLQHRLVQLALRLLRAEVWAHDDRKKLNRVAIRSIPKGMSEVPVVLIWSRLVITGSQHQRLHEELTLSGGTLAKDGYVRIRTLNKLEELLAAGKPIEPSQHVFDALQKSFRSTEKSIAQTVESRSVERRDDLKSALDRRRVAEEKDLQEILDSLEQMISGELKDSTLPKQSEFWPSDEREQLKRDEETLRARLARIPSERKSEIEAIGRRYADPIHRTFPVAVEFLVPEGFGASR